ncbi:hypothetical protein FOZ63_030370 [Perkinsus olseni]|uniref:Uncharacterized protein n=1 Tax=Perkinsus olseni TaxID=32597 RepID=A0A7J6P9E9_PEROL|nr:hypothetical protein FOZ63_030370 [Perkinsus olseni]
MTPPIFVASDLSLPSSMLAGYNSASSSDSESDTDERDKEVTGPLPSATSALADYDSAVGSRKKQRMADTPTTTTPSQPAGGMPANAKALTSSGQSRSTGSGLIAPLLTGGLAPVDIDVGGVQQDARASAGTSVWDEDPPEALRKNKKRSEMVEMMRGLGGVSSRELKNIQELGATAQDIDPSSLQDDHWYEAQQANEQAQKVQEAALGDFYDNTEGAKQANPGGSVGKNHKRKHHINWLAADTIDNGAKRLLDLGTQAGKRGQTARKYGW